MVFVARFFLFLIIMAGGFTTGCDFNTDIAVDDAAKNLPQFSVSDSSVAEGNSANFTFNFQEPAPRDYIVVWAIEEISAEESDLFSISGQVEVKRGDTSFTISVPTMDDSRFEDDEHFNLVIKKIDSFEKNEIVAKGTIQNNDLPPTVQFQVASQAVTENVGVATTLVLLSAVSEKNVFVPYTISGTSDGSDHNASSGVISILAGDVAAAVGVAIVSDSDPETDETLIYTMGTPTNASVGTNTSHTITILDDDGSLNIAAPLPSGFANLGNQSSLTVSGTCGTDGVTVTISADDGNGTTAAVTPGVQPTCSSGSFTTTLNVSSLDDGSITISADHLTLSDSVTLIKDAVNPTVSGSITPVTSYVNPTNESNLNFSGTCSEFNQSVSITIDDSNGATSAITVGTVCTAGNVFSLSIDVSSLDDDTLSVNLSHQDLAGNQQTTTLSSLTKDTLVPTMAITSPTGTDYINVSNVVLFPVSGSCSEAGQDVLLTVDDSNGATTAATGTVTCSGGNTFSGNLNLSGLDNGAIDITASHVDAAGNSVNAVPVSLVKDTVVPSLSIAVPTGGAFIFSGNVTAFTMSGSCSEAGRDVSYFVNDENGGTAEISGTVSCTGANDFSTSLDLSSLEDGNITFTASHTDVAGNEVEASSVLATKDTAAPVVAVVSPLATDYINLLNQSSFLVSGTCSDVGQTVKVSMDDANGATVAVENTVACSGANNFSMNLNLSTLDDGVINIAVSHDDSAGNSVIGTPVSLIKDTVAPSVAITSPIATDMINGGNLTNFAFSGTCSEVGESIELVVDDSNGGTPSVTATIPCSGSNNFTTNLDLSGLDDGPIHFDASHTDTAGNSVTATRVTITKDTGLPSVAITAPIVSDFVNSVSEGSFTISGTCSDVSEDVHLSVDDTNGATTAVTTTISCSGSNNFSTALNLSTLDDGTITISVSHEDASSNVTNGSPVSLTKDTALPVVALTAPTVSDYINSGNVGSFTISGTCSEVGQVINLSSDDTNGGTSSVDTSTACSGANNFSTTVNLSGLDDDSITISVSHVDVAGNSATGAPVTLTKDTGLPTASITSPTETDFANFTTKNAFPINGSCSETGKSVSISIDDTNGGTAPVTVSVACDGANDYSTTANLSSLDDGTLTVSVTHVDDAENSSVAVTVDFTKDTGLPTVSITSPLAASYINATSQSSYAVSGSCSEVGRDVVVSVDDVNGGTAAVTSDVACQAGNIFSTVLDVSSLDDGAVNLTASHSDAAGNTGNATLVAVTKDTVAPSVSILFPDITDTISTGNEGSFTISGSCSEEGRAVTLVVADGSVITPDVSPGTQPNCSSGTFTTSVDLSSLDDGNITITADHNDAALNEAVQSSVTVLKDSALPSVTIAFPTVSDYINTGNVGTFSVNGTCTEASQDVDISIDDTNGGTTAVTATVSCTGGNNYTASLDLSSLDDDSLTVTVTHDDSVGNTSSPETVVLTKDTVRPTATINQSISETVGSCVFSNQADPAFAFPLEFRVTFSEAVNPSSFSYGSFINSGTGGGVSFSGSLTSCGDNQNYSLKVVSMSPMGSMDFSLSAGEISDVAGNTNGVASGGTDTSILYYDSPFYWVGSVDSNWWTAGNWSGGSVPTSTDVAKFSDVCGGNCNANINGNVNVGGVDLQSSYSGTLTQESARTIILQESGWTQSGGSFVGGNADITFINSDFTVSSGSFTATSAKIFISRNLNIGAGATFNHNSGTIEVNANSYIP